MSDSKNLARIQHDDAPRAFAFATPGIRQTFGSWRTNGCQLARLTGTET